MSKAAGANFFFKFESDFGGAASVLGIQILGADSIAQKAPASNLKLLYFCHFVGQAERIRASALAG
ncbi:hypothetical protein ACFQDI_03805 [Prosthecobacter fluviatilis]|uniref:Uncharacterized protein n=1 Tax=Prosthecobacter fluviatilis TaxID=445931 RepID=A0ABW0KLP5_9BACT